MIKVLRVRVWLLVKQFWGDSARQRLANAGFVLVLLAAAGYGLFWLAGQLQGPKGMGMLTALLPTGAMMLFFFMLIQLADTLHQLFLAPDLQWVLRAPLPLRAVFNAKLIECSFGLLLPVLALAGMLGALGAAQSAQLPYYPLALLCVLALALGVTALGMMLVCALAWLFPPTRLRELLPVGFGLVSVGGILLQQWLMPRIAGWEAAVRLMVAALLDVRQMTILAGLLTAGALLLYLLAFGVFRGVYAVVFSRLQTAPAQGGRKTGRVSRPGWTSIFSEGMRFLVQKEWLNLWREPRRLTNLFLIPLMTGVLLVPMFSLEGVWQTLIFWFILFYSGIFGVNSAQDTALTAFTLEGRRFTWLLASPMRMRTVMWSKYWVSLLPTMLPWAAVFLAGGWLLHLPAWQILALLVAMLLNLAGACAVCLAFGAEEAQFTETTPNTKSMNQAAAFAALGLGLLWMLFVFALVIGAVLLFAPNSPLVQATAAGLGGLPVAGTLLGGRGLPFLAVGAAGMLVFIFILRRLWKSAIHHLETWEMV